jgi:hypothetical protein
MGAGEMKILFYIIAAIFLFFTAPIWVPALGILGLATIIGGGAAVIAANHATEAASPPAYVQSAPAPEPVVGCPCHIGAYIGGNPSDPHNWTMIWSDGSAHSLAERLPNRSEEQAIAFAAKMRDSIADPREMRLPQNMLAEWGISYRVQ